MSVIPNDEPDRPDGSVAFEIAGSGWLAIRSSEIGQLRPRVAAAFPNTISVGLLKHTDPQNLVALLLLKRLLDETPAINPVGDEWGLVAAGRTLGRSRVAESLGKYRENGAWTTSPHLIPNCSLHSQPGILSQALKLHGPNIGAGGMKGSEGEALWAAAALLEGDRLPGVWLVMTGWEKETLAGEDLECRAVAFALRPLSLQSTLPRLVFDPDASEPFTLELVIEAMRNGAATRWFAGRGRCPSEPSTRNLGSAA